VSFPEDVEQVFSVVPVVVVVKKTENPDAIIL
jgi:hypothetical protein